MRYDVLTRQFLIYPKGGSQPTATTQTVQNFSPEEAAQRAKVQEEANRIYGQTAGTISSAPYPGAAPVPFSLPTQAAQAGILNFGFGQGQQLANQLGQATQFGLHDVLYPSTNPALQDAIQSAIRPVTQSYLDPGGVMAQLRADFGGGGQYGGTRHALASGTATGRYFDTIGGIAADLANRGYGQGLDTFGRTMVAAPQTLSAMLFPQTAIGAVGQQMEGLQQAQADYDAAARLWELNKEWTPLQNYANIVFGGASPGTTVTQTGAVPQANRFSSALGGAIGGYGLASMLPAAMGINPLVGAGLGLAMSLFS